MSIYRLDDDSAMAARWHCTQHLSVMAMSAASLLSQVHGSLGYKGPVHKFDGTGPYQPRLHFDENIRPFRWIKQSLANYRWTARLCASLLEEYERRSGKKHGSLPVQEWLCNNLPSLPDQPETPFLPQTLLGYEHLFEVPGNSVATCRKFYALKLSALRNGPKWFLDSEPPWLAAALASFSPEDRTTGVALLKVQKFLYKEGIKQESSSAAKECEVVAASWASPQCFHPMDNAM